MHNIVVVWFGVKPQKLFCRFRSVITSRRSISSAATVLLNILNFFYKLSIDSSTAEKILHHLVCESSHITIWSHPSFIIITDEKFKLTASTSTWCTSTAEQQSTKLVRLLDKYDTKVLIGSIHLKICKNADVKIRDKFTTEYTEYKKEFYID